MATIKQGILGAFSGKVGNVVGSSWKGIPVMKSLPPSVSNPRTAAQLAQRSAMSQAVAFAKPILSDVIKPLNDRFVSRQSGYNSFIKRNIKLVASELLADRQAIKLSAKGNKAQLIDAVASESGPSAMQTKVIIQTTSEAGQGLALSSDIPVIVCRNLTKGIVGGKRLTGLGRGAESSVQSYSATFENFASEEDDVIDVYLTFVRADGTEAFDTAFDTTLFPAE
jgi:hypothetical protein